MNNWFMVRLRPSVMDARGRLLNRRSPLSLFSHLSVNLPSQGNQSNLCNVTSTYDIPVYRTLKRHTWMEFDRPG